MQLRWLEGSWGFGKFKLQYRKDKYANEPGDGPPWIDVPTLGLSEEVEKKSSCVCGGYSDGVVHRTDGPCYQMEKKSEEGKVEWCKHWYRTPDKAEWYFNQGAFTLNYDCEVKYAQFCPICGEKRPPSTPSLRERLAQEMFNHIDKVGVHPMGKDFDWGSYADAVLDFLSKEKS